MVRSRFAALLIAAWLPAATARAPAGERSRTVANARPVELVVIVQSDVPVTAITPDDVRRIFLLRTRFWHTGVRVAPANLSSSSPLREAFSRAVLGQSVRDMRGFWNDLYFHGTLPPPSVESEPAMLLYVSRTPGAIGYVSRDALVNQPAGVRAVLALESAIP